MSELTLDRAERHIRDAKERIQRLRPSSSDGRERKRYNSKIDRQREICGLFREFDQWLRSERRATLGRSGQSGTGGRRSGTGGRRSRREPERKSAAHRRSPTPEPRESDRKRSSSVHSVGPGVAPRPSQTSTGASAQASLSTFGRRTPSATGLDARPSDKEIVVVVGAGPVGLMTSLWLLQAGKHVVLCEGRDFTRTQILYMQDEYWASLPTQVRTELEADGACHYDYLTTVCMPTGPRVSVVIKRLQTVVLAHLIAAFPSEFKVVRTVATLELLRNIPGVRIVIVSSGSGGSGGGGGKTGIAESLWERATEGETPDGLYRKIHVANAAVVTFEARQDPAKAESVEAQQFLRGAPQQMVVRSFRALPDYGYVGVQLSERTMRTLERAPHPRLLPIFRLTPEGGVYAKALDTLGFADVRNEKIAAFPIDLRTARQFHFSEGDAQFYLLGDAAFTTHFFTGMGMNLGLDVASRLVELLLDEGSDAYRGDLYETLVAEARDSLWDSVVPLVLPDMDAIIAHCMATSDAGSCMVSGAATVPNQAAIQKLQDRVYEHSR